MSQSELTIDLSMMILFQFKMNETPPVLELARTWVVRPALGAAWWLMLFLFLLFLFFFHICHLR